MGSTVAITALELLKPFIWRKFGEAAMDPEARLQTLRALIPGLLPDDYAETLLALNQAVSLEDNRIISIEPPRPREPGIFEYIGLNPPIERLNGLGDSHYNVISELAGIGQRLPPGLIAIGSDAGANQICLDVSERGNGRVYHWFRVGDPGPDDEQGRPGWGNTFLLAESFTDLCRRLRLVLPDDEPRRPIGKICFSRP